MTSALIASQELAIVALGANLGDAASQVQRAMDLLQPFSRAPILRSSLWQTTPVDCPPNSPLFINAAVGLTPLAGETPESLLAKLLTIERKFGRRPKQILNEPRPIDLDLIAFGRETRSSNKLTLPHPRAHLRRFVLEPLCEIAPGLVLPGQTRTARELLVEVGADDSVRKFVS